MLTDIYTSIWIIFNWRKQNYVGQLIISLFILIPLDLDFPWLVEEWVFQGINMEMTLSTTSPALAMSPLSCLHNKVWKQLQWYILIISLHATQAQRFLGSHKSKWWSEEWRRHPSFWAPAPSPSPTRHSSPTLHLTYHTSWCYLKRDFLKFDVQFIKMDGKHKDEHFGDKTLYSHKLIILRKI